MRPREIDIPFADSTGAGLVSVTDAGDRVRLSIDKIDVMAARKPRARVALHCSLTETQATTLRDALDAWIHRNDPQPAEPDTTPTR